MRPPFYFFLRTSGKHMVLTIGPFHWNCTTQHNTTQTPPMTTPQPPPRRNFQLVVTAVVGHTPNPATHWLCVQHLTWCRKNEAENTFCFFCNNELKSGGKIEQLCKISSTENLTIYGRIWTIVGSTLWDWLNLLLVIAKNRRSTVKPSSPVSTV